jgi:DNA-directed RNA polymerase specialized sigma24 family protein
MELVDMRGVSIDQDAFERLLAWLDSDRERAGQKYELLYSKLIALFGWWSCERPDELADQTLDRTAALLETPDARKEPYAFLRGVARFIFLEDLRKRRMERSALRDWPCGPSDPGEAEKKERRLMCLEHCMSTLPPETRELIRRYYQDHGRTMISNREDQARELAITPRALRLRVFRIRQNLEACIRDCGKPDAAVRNISPISQPYM